MLQTRLSPPISRIFFLVDVKQTSHDGIVDDTTQRVRVVVTRHYRESGCLNWVTLDDRFLRGITIWRLSNGEWNREDTRGTEGGDRLSKDREDRDSWRSDRFDLSVVDHHLTRQRISAKSARFEFSPTVFSTTSMQECSSAVVYRCCCFLIANSSIDLFSRGKFQDASEICENLRLL